MSTEEPLDVANTLDRHEEEWLLKKAYELFDEGELEEAHMLCNQVIGLKGRKAGHAQTLIRDIEARFERLMFERAVELFNLEHNEEARQLFMLLSARPGQFEAVAQEYLSLLERRRALETLQPRVTDNFETQYIRPELPSYSDDWDNVEMAEVSKEPLPGPGGVAVAEMPKEVIIKKVPHMDIVAASEIRPEARFDVSIFVDDTSERPGEESEPVEFNAPPEMKKFETEVRLLATPHFVIDDKQIKSISIDRDEPRSNSAEFKVVVRSKDELAFLEDYPVAGLTAVFAYLGRVSGKVSRKVPIVGIATPEIPYEPAAPETKAVKEQIRIDAVAQPADLTVEIVATPENDGRHFWCTVRTPLLPQYKQGVTEAWNLPDVTSNIVGGYMKEFAAKGMSKLQRLTALKGAGRKLFQASPGIFQRVFWDLVDLGPLPRTISIVSEEPYIPWELMIPRRTRDGLTVSRIPLGVEFVIGRWIPKHAIAGRQKIPMKDCYVIAPNYVDRKALPHAQAESAFLLKKFPAPAGQQVKPADFDTIATTFGDGGKTIVHFACHGGVSDGKQVIYLESEPPLSADMVLGMDLLEQAFGEKKPFVFLNACEVGRQVPGLVGPGGFAESFIDLGASAVIAPLWSVKDTLAHEIAKDFYNSVTANPDLPFAEIMRSIRAQAYDPNIGEDTYAAYCYYGDPLSSVG